MAKNVVCKKCNNLVNDWCEKVIDSPDPDIQRDCPHFREKTNADRIRSMSDEELAEFIVNIKARAAFCKAVGNNEAFEKLCSGEWLRQPAEEDDND